MRNKSIISALAVSAALATAGCGSTSGGSSTTTVTSPPKTITRTVTKTDNGKVLACQQALTGVLASAKELLAATRLYENQIKPAYLAGVDGGSVDGITAKIGEGTSHVHKATHLLNSTSQFAQVCRS